MVKRILTAAAVLLAGAAYAQPTPLRIPPKYTVATAPACVDGEPKLFAVTDGSSSTDCTVGGGSTEVICKCTDGTAAAVGSGGGGSSNSFETINAPAGTDPVADSATDTLNITCAGGLTCTGTAATDTLDITMGTAATATALAADPSDCAANQFANAIAASGNLTCSALADADIPDTITASGYVPITLAGQQSITATGAGNDITLTAADEVIVAGNFNAASAVTSGSASFVHALSTNDGYALGYSATVAVGDGGAHSFTASSGSGAQSAELQITRAGLTVNATDSTDSIYFAADYSGFTVDVNEGSQFTVNADTGSTFTGIFRLTPSAAPPVACAGGTAGGLYIDSNDGLLYYCNGSSWGTVDTDTLPGNDEVTEAMLKAVNTPTDEYLLTYESTTGDFEWAQHAPTATALAANGANCSAGQYPLGVDASGAVESCTAVSTTPASDSITEAMLKAVDTASDEECLTYETTTGDFEWQTCGSAGIGGSTGATDDAILIADGVGGATLAASTAFVDSGSVFRLGGANSNNYPALRPKSDNSGTFEVVKAANPVTQWGNISTEGGRISASLISNLSSASSTVTIYGSANLLQLGTGAGVAWTNNAAAEAGSLDLSLKRSAANVLIVGDGSTGIGKVLSAVLVEANTAGSGTPNVLTAAESGTVITNEGATAKAYQTLPSAAAGYRFTFIVQDTDGLRVTAAAGDDIRIGATTSTTAGYCESTTVGDSVTLVAINATSFYAVAMMGSGWTCAILFPAFGVRRRLRDLIAANDNL